MKSFMVLLLVLTLVLGGFPHPSRAEAPNAFDAKEKTALSSLSTPTLIRQRAGEMIRTAEKLDPATKKFFEQLEVENPWLLEQRAGDESVVPPPSWPVNAPNAFGQQNTAPKGDGISTGGAVLITLGAVGLLGLLAIGNFHGGSC